MALTQIAVFLENKKGKLLDLTKTLSQNGINVEQMTIADSSDFGIIRAITSDNERAKNILKEAGFAVVNMNILGVEVDNVPGTLTTTLELLNKNDIQIEYLYSYTNNNKAILLIKVENVKIVEELLNSNNIKTI